MAETYNNLYSEICTFENLYLGYMRARRGKNHSAEVLLFRQSLERNLFELQRELSIGTYRTGAYRFFDVFEPKRRQIAALPFRDRVVQHALVEIVNPIWERRFIFDSYACRVGKGTHAGAARAQHFLRIVKRNYGGVFALKADVRKFFASINHEDLKRLVRRRIACPATLRLLDGIIDSTPGERGIPIGNLTSQMFANVYLHELDEFVKQALRERYYLRYMDDFCIIGHDKAHLQQVRRRIEGFLRDELRLELNQKTQVFPVSTCHGRALDFLGYRIWPTHMALRKSSGLRMQRGMKKLTALYNAGLIPLDRVRASLNSWLGHCNHCSSYGIRKRVMRSAMLLPGGATRSAPATAPCVRPRRRPPWRWRARPIQSPATHPGSGRKVAVARNSLPWWVSSHCSPWMQGAWRPNGHVAGRPAFSSARHQGSPGSTNTHRSVSPAGACEDSVGGRCDNTTTPFAEPVSEGRALSTQPSPCPWGGA